MIPVAGAVNRFAKGEVKQGFFNLGLDALSLVGIGVIGKSIQGAKAVGNGVKIGAGLVAGAQAGKAVGAAVELEKKKIEGCRW
jgi:hypothetical protein